MAQIRNPSGITAAPFLLFSPGSLAAASWPLHSPVAVSVGLRGQGEVVEEVQKAMYAAASAASAASAAAAAAVVVAPGPSGKGRGQQESWAGMRAVQSKDIRNDQEKAHGFFSECHSFSCLGITPLRSLASVHSMHYAPMTQRQTSPQLSWKSLTDIFYAKTTTPQTTIRLLHDGESLIGPSGELLGLWKRALPSLCSASKPGPLLHPPLFPSSACFGDTSRFH